MYGKLREKVPLLVWDLLDAGADVYFVGGQNVLHLACFSGHMEIIKMLLRAGCNYRQKDKDDKLPGDKIILSSTKREFLEIINLINLHANNGLHSV